MAHSYQRSHHINSASLFEIIVVIGEYAARELDDVEHHHYEQEHYLIMPPDSISSDYSMLRRRW